MYQLHTSVQSDHAAKYLVTLCRHFGRKVNAEWDDTTGMVEFPSGVTRMTLSPAADTLTICCQSDSEDNLEIQKSIIDEHVSLFGRRETIELVWSEVSKIE